MTSKLAGRSLNSVTDLSDEEIVQILDTAEAMAQDPTGHADMLQGYVVCTAFFEPSTRTRLSFESAAHRLGAGVIGFADAATTSGAKGETLEDTVKVLCGYADLLVMRHPETGAAHRAAAVADIPVVNAGDGAGEHPTQTLLDLYTMRKLLGGLDGKTVAVIGDLRYGRTVHSLVPALRRLGTTVLAVPAPGLDLPGGDARVVTLDEAAAEADVLYVTRVQRERFTDPSAFEAARGKLRVDRALLERNDSTAIVMHPLPRVDEIAEDVDSLPSAKYFEQAWNGVPVRMAVLAHLVGAL